MFLSLDGKAFIPIDRIMAVLPIEFVQARRMKDVVAHHGKLVNLTYGKHAASVIIMDSGHVILTSKNAEELVVKIWAKRG